MGGLALWLALHEPDSGRLFAVGAAADLGLVPPLLPGITSTYVLLEEQALAALVCLDQQLDSGTPSSAFELGVHVFGAAGHDLAQRLVGTIHQWHASGRRATAGLRIRAYPHASNTHGDTAAVIDKHYSRLLLDWPEQSSRFT